MYHINNFIVFLENKPKYIYWFLFFLSFPAFLIYLGLNPFNLDEATRAVVTLEMKFSGNYITPTVNGEFYYNKPPLFNWIQLIFVNLSGSVGEWIFRLPVVVSLFGFGLTVFYILKKELGLKVALFTAFALVTSSRILFYDSFKGLIDISFSWIIFMNFWVIFNNFRKGNFFRLFILSWFLTALGFLLKGMPALVFQCVTLLVYFLSQKSFKKLFSLQHVGGFIFFLAIAGVYLLLYQKQNPVSHFIETLWIQSAMRTPINNDIFLTFKHLFRFPLDFIFHFLPWTAFIFLLFFKGVFARAMKEDILKFLTIVFISNIIVYWISPAIYPRYLFMFLPSFFAVLSFSYFNRGEFPRLSKYLVEPLLQTIVILIPIGLCLLPLFINAAHHSYFYLKIFSTLGLALVLGFLYFQLKAEKIFVVIGIVLMLRLVFNFFVLEEREYTGIDFKLRADAMHVAAITKDKPLYLYKDCPIHNVSTYYIERERQKILTRWKAEMVKGNLYIIPGNELSELPANKVVAVFKTNLKLLNLYVIELE